MNFQHLNRIRVTEIQRDGFPTRSPSVLPATSRDPCAIPDSNRCCPTHSSLEGERTPPPEDKSSRALDTLKRSESADTRWRGAAREKEFAGTPPPLVDTLGSESADVRPERLGYIVNIEKKQCHLQNIHIHEFKNKHAGTVKHTQ